MAKFTAGTGISFSYLRDRDEFEALDQGAIQRDLACPRRDPAVLFARGKLSDCDHVLLAVDRQTGEHLALLGAYDVIAGDSFVLFLDTGFVTAQARGRNLMQRLVAFLMLGIAGGAQIPRVVACCTADPAWYGMVRRLGDRFSGAQVFPSPKGQPVSLSVARLGRQIAASVAPGFRYDLSTGTLRGGKARHGLENLVRPLACDDHPTDAAFGEALGPVDEVIIVLDLRGQAEDVVIEEARQVFRARTRAPSAPSWQPKGGRSYVLPAAVSAM